MSLMSRGFLDSLDDYFTLLNDIFALQREHHDAIKLVAKARQEYENTRKQWIWKSSKVSPDDINSSVVGLDILDKFEEGKSKTALSESLRIESIRWQRIQKGKGDKLGVCILKLIQCEGDMWTKLSAIFKTMKETCQSAGWPTDQRGTASPLNNSINLRPKTPTSDPNPNQIKNRSKILKRWITLSEKSSTLWANLRDTQRAHVLTCREWWALDHVAHSLAIQSQYSYPQSLQIDLLEMWLYLLAPSDLTEKYVPPEKMLLNLTSPTQIILSTLSSTSKMLKQILQKEEDLLSQFHVLDHISKKAAAFARANGVTSQDSSSKNRRGSIVVASGSNGSQMMKNLQQLDIARHKLDKSLLSNRLYKKNLIVTFQVDLWKTLEACTREFGTAYNLFCLDSEKKYAGNSSPRQLTSYDLLNRSASFYGVNTSSSLAIRQPQKYFHEPYADGSSRHLESTKVNISPFTNPEGKPFDPFSPDNQTSGSLKILPISRRNSRAVSFKNYLGTQSEQQNDNKTTRSEEKPSSDNDNGDAKEDGRPSVSLRLPAPSRRGSMYNAPSYPPKPHHAPLPDTVEKNDTTPRPSLNNNSTTTQLPAATPILPQINSAEKIVNVVKSDASESKQNSVTKKSGSLSGRLARSGSADFTGSAKFNKFRRMTVVQGFQPTRDKDVSGEQNLKPAVFVKEQMLSSQPDLLRNNAFVNDAGDVMSSTENLNARSKLIRTGSWQDQKVNESVTEKHLKFEKSVHRKNSHTPHYKELFSEPVPSTARRFTRKVPGMAKGDGKIERSHTGKRVNSKQDGHIDSEKQRESLSIPDDKPSFSSGATMIKASSWLTDDDNSHSARDRTSSYESSNTHPNPHRPVINLLKMHPNQDPAVKTPAYAQSNGKKKKKKKSTVSTSSTRQRS
jgi:hypothetical protein